MPCRLLYKSAEPRQKNNQNRSDRTPKRKWDYMDYLRRLAALVRSSQTFRTSKAAMLQMILAAIAIISVAPYTQAQTPTASISQSPSTTQSYDPFTLTWSSTNAASCAIDKSINGGSWV